MIEHLDLASYQPLTNYLLLVVFYGTLLSMIIFSIGLLRSNIQQNKELRLMNAHEFLESYDTTKLTVIGRTKQEK